MSDLKKLKELLNIGENLYEEYGAPAKFMFDVYNDQYEKDKTKTDSDYFSSLMKFGLAPLFKDVSAIPGLVISEAIPIVVHAIDNYINTGAIGDLSEELNTSTNGFIYGIIGMLPGLVFPPLLPIGMLIGSNIGEKYGNKIGDIVRKNYQFYDPFYDDKYTQERYDISLEEMAQKYELNRTQRKEYLSNALATWAYDPMFDSNRENMMKDPFLNVTPEQMHQKYDADRQNYRSYFTEVLNNWAYDPFFNSNEDYMKDNPYFNRHAIGLPRVPYDNFPALLHEGESVLTKRETNNLHNGLGGVNIAKLSDTIIVREEADIDRIATALTFRIRQAALNMA